MSSLADVDVDVKEKKAAKTEPGTTGLRPEAKAGEKKEPPKSPGVTEKGREPATTPSAEPGRVLAGFQSDSIGMDDKDKLDIEGVVEAFCSVMLSQKVHPPLSIGLFGDWGSGKSFFMEEMWAAGQGADQGSARKGQLRLARPRGPNPLQRLALLRRQSVGELRHAHL